MAFAYFIGLAPRGFWPIENGGELAILYCWLFLNLAAQGLGAWTLRVPRGRPEEPVDTEPTKDTSAGRGRGVDCP